MAEWDRIRDGSKYRVTDGTRDRLKLYATLKNHGQELAKIAIQIEAQAMVKELKSKIEYELAQMISQGQVLGNW